MEIIEMKITDLVPAPYNPRKKLKPGDKEYEKIKKSILEFGYVDPVIWNRQSGNVVGGHQRLSVLLEMGETTCEVSVVDLPDEKEKALNLALNKIAGEWDMPMLEDLLAELNTTDLDMELTGFDLSELDELLHIEPGLVDAEAQIDRAAELNKVWRVTSGDLWQIGEHRLLCGDSTKKEDVERVLGENQPMVMATDPPYGIKLDMSWRDKARPQEKSNSNKNVVPNDDRADWTDAWQLFKGNIAYIWHASAFSDVVTESLRRAGFEICQQLIWTKSSMTLGRSDYQWKHEPCWYAVRKGKNHGWIGDRKQTTIFEAKAPNQVAGVHTVEDRTEHPTQKPIDCFMMIRNHDSEFVYDPFLGSGTTMVACQNLKRKCLGIEISPEYCAVILQRMTDAFPGLPLKKIE
jgi:DNA modification methylase